MYNKENFNYSNKASYYPIEPKDNSNYKSSRIHFHLDAESHEEVQEIVSAIFKLSDGIKDNLKIYPINYLELGPQVQKEKIYQQMMNFHKISNAENEAFVTGRFGDLLDVNAMKSILSAAEKTCKETKKMVELEEYLGLWSFNENGEIIVEHEFEPLDLDMDVFSEFLDYMCEPIPNYELHFGFNIPKKLYSEMPINLEKLMSLCSRSGFNLGGWFVFSHNERWSYRSNEFTYDDINTSKDKLFEKAKALRKIIHGLGFENIEPEFSIEIVHAIWKFEPTDNN